MLDLQIQLDHGFEATTFKYECLQDLHIFSQYLFQNKHNQLEGLNKYQMEPWDLTPSLTERVCNHGETEGLRG
jgi:hypothetical protein